MQHESFLHSTEFVYQDTVTKAVMTYQIGGGRRSDGKRNRLRLINERPPIRCHGDQVSWVVVPHCTVDSLQITGNVRTCLNGPCKAIMNDGRVDAMGNAIEHKP